VEALRHDDEALLAEHRLRPQYRIPCAQAGEVAIDRLGRHAPLDQAVAHGCRLVVVGLTVIATHQQVLHLTRPPQRRGGIEAVLEVAVGPALRTDRRGAQHQRHVGAGKTRQLAAEAGVGQRLEASFGKPRQQRDQQGKRTQPEHDIEAQPHSAF
jgi:hypothetical protein